MPSVAAMVFVWVSHAWQPPASATNSDCDATLRGRVVDATTAEPIPRARVRIRPRDGQPTDVRTLDDGTFALEHVCPGTHTVAVERADYSDTAQRVEVGTSTEPLVVSLEPRDVAVLDDVVVVAPARQELDASPANSLDDDALAAVRGRSLAESLSTLSGVAMLRGPAGGMGKPIIRGQVGRRNLILYDRVRHESQKWGIDHAPEIDPFAADSITVLKGAGAIRYGPDAIGGVVLIDPPPLPSEPGVSGETHLLGVSNGLRGTTATRVQGAHAAAPGFGWRVEGNATRGAALMTPQYPLDNTGSRIWNAGATLGYARRGFELTATYRHHDMKAGIFTGLRNETPEEFAAGLGLDRPAGADSYSRGYEIERPFQRVTHDLGIVRGRAPLRNAGELVATYAIQHNDRDEFEVVRDTITGPQLELDLTTHMAELVFEQAPVSLGPKAVLEGSTGGMFTHQRNRHNGSDPAFLPDYLQDGGGVFVLQRVELARFDVEGGARYDGMLRRSALDDRAFNPFRAQDRLPGDCEPTPNGGRCDTAFHAGSGSLGLILHPVLSKPGFVTRIDATTAVRFPSIDEQFIKGSAPSFPVFANGNGRLGLERTWGGTATVGFAEQWGYVEGSAYGNYVDDYIYFRAVPQSDDPGAPDFSECAPLTCGVQGAFPLFSPAAVDALFYGGELAGNVRPPKWPVSLQAQGSWVRASQQPSGDPLAFIPPDRYRLSVTYHWPDVGRLRNGHVGVGGTIVDRQRRFDPEADFAPPPPAYGLLEAQSGVEIPLDEQRLQIALSGRNLTNARYRDYTSVLRYFANEPGWEVMLRLSLHFAFGAPSKPAKR